MIEEEKEYPKYYAVKHKEFSERIESRSGGFFSALSNYILEKKGIVYGCLLDSSFVAIHARATNKDECKLFRGSKYVQSNLKDVYKCVREDLSNNLFVLFSGTSCQIDGLKRYLNGIDLTKLLLVDIICQGVPSPLIWDEYKKSLKRRYGEDLIKVDFRDKKKYGWGAHVLSFTFGGKKVINSSKFADLFYSHFCIRPTCYYCPYKGEHRPSDISLADFWGIDKVIPSFNDDNGVSLVLINNEKGQLYFNLVNNQIEYVKTELAYCIQPPLVENFNIPNQRERFWEDYRKKGFDYVLKKYIKFNLKQRIKWEIKSLFRKKTQE
ncbi:coenzyme F420-reducing hydrogenase beta subunit [Hydrogenispora ethanolica]|uniref:Coenzyme F420-reducing hydrogenase beta subunit n=1 Tax=Hydrogenispora ethanolica TaxID=1082276 RepID=A0A4R1RVS1_HYDET|nr:Coenzyme F420 hydrogenase/dehydrogenase, beta subunit C-terminal domain [Hydrogenispora ethanolica]TCL70751.1 coenzyme F420-reducing hydrogenase beta subunit [Hydrogenispora ethanolica]